MENLKLFLLIFKKTHMNRFLYSFLVFYLIACVLIWLLDPDIPSYGDALWFGFMVVTTVGFGDYTVLQPLARLVTALLGIYGILLFGFVCGVGASWLFEKLQLGKDESVSQMVWQLEHLDELDDSALNSLKQKIQKRHEARTDPAVSSQPAQNVRQEK